MEIESHLSESNTNFQQIFENIGDYSDSQHLQPLMSVNKSDLKAGQTPDFDSNYRNISAFDNSELCVSPQEDEEYMGPPVETKSTGKDRFCWVCHKERSNITCRQCPRSYHLKCIATAGSSGNNGVNNGTNSDNKPKSSHKSFDSWLCVECNDIMKDEEDDSAQAPEEDNSRSSATGWVGPKLRLSQTTAEELSQLLKFALQTIRQSADPTFHKPVSPIVFPDYHQLVQYPMDLSTIDRNIKNNKYKSQTSFLADIKWIVHNCIIYNHNNHPLTTNAKYLSRVAKNETAEMEICPDCFKNFYTITDTSFAEPCRRPHQLVFARVKGYPLWPAKVVRLGKQNDVDCRFFGTHDRAWVAVDACWVVSEVHPGSKPSKTHKSKFEGAMRELAVHIERLNAKFPEKFKYSPQKTPFSTKQIFICDEDNDYYNKMMSEVQSTHEKSLKNITNNSNNNTINDNNVSTNSSDKIDETIEECVSNSTKPVIPGVFSLSSDKVLDEFKSELNISNESSNLLIKNVKSNAQIKEDLTSKTRTARVGKRNVAEALRASKVQRTSTSSISSSSSSPTQRMQTNQNSILANNSHPVPANSALIKSKAQCQNSTTTAQDSALNNNMREEMEKMRKQMHFDAAMHREEIREIKHNSDLVLMEMRQSWVTERDKALEDERQKHELERKLMVSQFENEKKKLLATIDETKRKQWCAECLKEAQLFCCYDTWYCTYDCQKSHWKSHVNVCQQIHKKS